MKALFHYILLLLLLLSLPLPIKSQDTPLSFGHMNSDNGLSHNRVSSIYQDERGFIWIGTRNGVSLYNGIKIEVYKHEKNNSNSLLSNEIKDIVGDKKGNVFIQTNKGLSQYNISQNKFTTITTQHATAAYFEKWLYFAVKDKIYRYENDTVKMITQLPDGIEITSLCLHGDSILAGTSHNGLFLLENERNISHLLSSGHIYNIFRDSSGWYWITSYDGLGIYILRNGIFSNYKTSSDPSTINSNLTYRCCEDKEGNIWIGTFLGLNKFDKHAQKFIRYYQENNGSDISVWGLCCDHQGNIWFGTYYSGVRFFNASKQFYKEYNISSVEQNSILSTPAIGEMQEDSRKNLWICTEGGGLCKYSLNHKTFQWYKYDTLQNSISHNNVKSIYYDAKRDVLWIGTYMGGLNKLDLKNNQFAHYMMTEDKFSIYSNIVMDIVPHGDSLLLSTHNGIMLFEPENGNFHPLFSNNEYFQKTRYTRELLVDDQSNLWIVNEGNGISYYNFKTNILTSYKKNPNGANGISSNEINKIYMDSDKRLWICTNEHGIDILHCETGSFENFDVNNGLGGSVVYSICELASNKFAITTDEGLSILDYSQKTIANYRKKYQIPLTDISERSLTKTSTGEVFIGGMNKIISFCETDLNAIPASYNIYPYRLYVDGQEVHIGDGTKILSQDLTSTKKITLNSKYQSFNIEYASTNYLLYNREEFVYKLEGFSKNWHKIDENNSISFTNIPPGEYILTIKALRKSDSLSPSCKLQIEVLPPFYNTMWAYFIYIVLGVSAVIIFLHIYKNWIRMQSDLEYEKIHAEETRQLNSERLRFYTDVSHEFCTPLTIIIGQIEMLLQSQKMGTSIYNTILNAHKSCIQLKDLISELLDFRKLEQGYMSVKAEQRNIVSFLHDHCLTFKKYADRMQITYKFISPYDDIQIWYDERLLRMVMNNLISNAFKHTPIKGRITVSVHKRENEILIEVTDSGKGIEEDQIDKIFNKFYQTKEKSPNSINSGIGLALSKGLVELHHGKIEVYSEPNVETTFIVYLKTGKEHFSLKEIAEDKTSENSQDYTLKDKDWNYPALQLQAETNETAVSSIPGCKMVVVENDINLCNMLVQLFEPFYQVYTAYDGNMGYELTKQKKPDIVVSDAIVPDISGFDLCKKIKGSIELCNIPVVLLTTRPESYLDGLKIGADDCVNKPFDIGLLLARCNNIVSNRIILYEKFSQSPQIIHHTVVDNIRDKQFIDKAATIVKEYMCNENFNIDTFARELNVSRTNLFNKIKNISKQTPAEFILSIRLKEAALLLRNEPSLNISEIAEKVGFSSSQYFRKCFKNKFHITPIDYRKYNPADNTEQDKEE